MNYYSKKNRKVNESESLKKWDTINLSFYEKMKNEMDEIEKRKMSYSPLLDQSDFVMTTMRAIKQVRA